MQTTPMPQSLYYLGPRLQAVRAVVAAHDLPGLREVWPRAERALAIQGVTCADLVFPTAKAHVLPFRKSILARARESFTAMLRAASEWNPNSAVMARTERLTRAMLTDCSSRGLIAPDVATAFVTSAKEVFAVTYSHPLKDDLRFVMQVLQDPCKQLGSNEDAMVDVLCTYIGPDISVYHKHLRSFATAATPSMSELMVLRARIQAAMVDGVERRIAVAMLDGASPYTKRDIITFHRWGFISADMCAIFSSALAERIRAERIPVWPR